MTLTYGSLFTGVGGFDLGFDRAGYECQWQVEWDPNCQQTLAHHWPHVPRFGDIQTVTANDLSPVDVITYGSPCQDLSLAGARKGLGGDRSSLFFDAMRIIKEMRDGTNGTFPRITIWENVPGALSSNGGADFRTVLSSLADIGALASWWYVLDAQYFGVPQRRRRVFVISVFDPSILNRTGHGPLLAVGQSRRRNPKKGRKPQPSIASTLGISPESPSGNETETVGALCARYFKGVGKQYVEEGKVVIQDDSHGDQLDFDPGVIGPLTSTGMSRARGTESVESNHVLVFTAQRVGEEPRIYEDVSPSLLSRMGTGGNNTPMVIQDEVEEATTASFLPGALSRLGGTLSDEIAPTLRAESHGGDNSPHIITELPIVFDSTNNGCSSNLEDLSPAIRIGAGPPAVAIPIQDGRGLDKQQNGLGVGDDGDPAYTLDTTGGQAVASDEPISFDGWNQIAEEGGIHRTLRSSFDAGDCIVFPSNMSAVTFQDDGTTPTLTVGSSVGVPSPLAVATTTVVRRLTPLECERLMGWDDFHTLYRADGKTNTDTARYKMCGNGVASPVAHWIAEQLLPWISPEQSSD